MKKKYQFVVAFTAFLGLSASIPVQAQGDLPAIAVYATGNIVYEDAKTVAQFMTASLINSRRYKGVERPEAFMSELNSELLAGGAGENPVAKVGKRYGVQYVCVAEVAPVLDAIQISAYIMDVATLGAVFTGSAVGAIKTAADLNALADNAVRDMLKGAGAPPAAQAGAAPEELPPEPAVYEPPAVSSYSAPAPDDSNAEGGEAEAPPAVSGKKAKTPKERPAGSPNRMSAGAGGFFSSDFGGGVKWESGARMVMPYYGWGGYLFFDAIYGEAFAGYQRGGGNWSNPKLKNLPAMFRHYVNFGLYGKYPVGGGSVKWFPLAGVEYGVSIYGNMDNAGGPYEFDGKSDWRGKRPDAGALSALWFKAGNGLDIGIGDRVYLRAEALYGFRTPNKFELEFRRFYTSDRPPENTLAGHGMDLKAGVGVKF